MAPKPTEPAPGGVYMTPEDIQRLTDLAIARAVDKLKAENPTAFAAPPEPSVPAGKVDIRALKAWLDTPPRPTRYWLIGHDKFEPTRLIQVIADVKAPVGLGEVDTGRRYGDVTLDFQPAPGFILDASPKFFISMADIADCAGVARRAEDIANPEYGFPDDTAVKAGDYSIEQALYAFEALPERLKEDVMSEAKFRVHMSFEVKKLEERDNLDREREQALLMASDVDRKRGAAVRRGVNTVGGGRGAPAGPPVQGPAMAMAGAAPRPDPNGDMDPKTYM